MNCKKCGKHILQPNVTYGINPNAVCNCAEPQKSKPNNLEWLSKLLDSFFILRSGLPNDDLEELKLRNASGAPREELGLAITAKINEMQTKLLDNIQASLDSHTVPEGKHLLSRSYVNNTLEFERKRKDEVLK